MLFVVDSPVDKELTPVDKLDMPVLSEEIPVEVEIDRSFMARFVALSCEPLIASVLVSLMRPAATLVI
nr:hypothetical protein [Paraburkholderia sprentiae]